VGNGEEGVRFLFFASVIYRVNSDFSDFSDLSRNLLKSLMIEITVGENRRF
jgi:hypothetical protein